MSPEGPLSRPRRARRARARLVWGSAACLTVGLAAIPYGWGNPGSDLPVALWAFSAGPWALGLVEGWLVWRSGRALEARGLEHALAAYAAGTGAAVLAATGAGFLGLWSAGALRTPCGPLDPLCGTLAMMALASMMAASTLGFAFPALLPPAAAWVSAGLLRGDPPYQARMGWASACVAAAWLLAILAGAALAHA